MSSEMISAYRPLSADAPLPNDVGEVNDPGNGWQCWAVRRHDKHEKLPTPRQCVQRRQGPRTKGAPRPRCCIAHRHLNEQASALAVLKAGDS